MTEFLNIYGFLGSTALEFALAFALVIVLVVVFHELGHFLFCRLFGVRVLKFQIGFGKPFWTRVDQHGTQWALCPWPIGGAVTPYSSKDPDAPAGLACEDFARLPWHKEFLVYAAGPAFSFLLAVLLFSIINLRGVDQLTPVLSAPPADSPAHRAGLHNGDLVLSVDGEPIRTYQQLSLKLIASAQDVDAGYVDLRVLGADGKQFPARIFYDATPRDANRVISSLGITPFVPTEYRALRSAVIEHVDSGSGASDAGLEAGDRIITMNGEPVMSAGEFANRINNARSKVAELTVARGSHILDIHMPIRGSIFLLDAGTRKALSTETLTDLKFEHSRGRSGVHLMRVDPLFRSEEGAKRFRDISRAFYVTVHYSPIEAISVAIHETNMSISMVASLVRNLMTGNASFKDNLSGPIGIADAARTSLGLGLNTFFLFVGWFSVSIGLMNLMPLLPLDGGHMARTLWERFSRKKVSDRAQSQLARAGMIAMAFLALCAILNDALKLIAD